MVRTVLGRQGHVLRYAVESSAEPIQEPTISPDSPVLRVADIFIHELLDRSGDVQGMTWWIFCRHQKTQSGKWVIAGPEMMKHPTDHRLKLIMKNPPRWGSWKSQD